MTQEQEQQPQSPHAHTNRLAASTSPYLLQHAHNPVDWYPWGPEALEKARAKDKPIFLSIGYSACHWCHVMERESFENEAIAKLMNDWFVNIKVDREERPDLDEIYMNFVQGFTGHGGWPMSTFLTPDGRPFYGGTYWPPAASRGMPGFPQILEGVHRLWAERRDTALKQAGDSADWLRETSAVAPAAADAELKTDILDNAVQAVSRGFDRVNGGFGGRPKFPHSMELSLLLRHAARTGEPQYREMVELSLNKMARGGIYDQLGGGFVRYSVDAHWTVPHFEKMLYDNALLTRTCLEAYQLTQDAFYAEVARETFDWCLREMQHPAGGIYSTMDADSEGEEGKYYVWSPAEIKAVLGDELGEFACRWYDVTDAGNFEDTGKSTLTTPKTIEQLARMLDKPVDEVLAKAEEARRRLLEARSQRVPPGTDTKILTSWNGMMIASLARAQILDEPRYRQAADRAADFILNTMMKDGRLLRTSKDGAAHLAAYVEDYACMIEALVDLYEAGFEVRRLEQAVALARTMIAHYFDKEHGGFFFTADDAEPLIVRSKNFTDNATPSGNSTAVSALLRLGELTGEKEFTEAAEKTLRLFAAPMAERPFAFANMLCALDQYLAGGREIAIVGAADAPETLAALAAVRARFLPARVIAFKEPGADGVDGAVDARVPLLAGKTALEGKPTFYVCRNFACSRPATTVEELVAQLAT